MFYKNLLYKSATLWDKNPHYIKNISMRFVFNDGALWMYNTLQNIDERHATSFSRSTRYAYYGYLKYSLSIALSVIGGMLLWTIHPALVLLAIVVFYLVEVHFLFLFPLLIDGARNPLWLSIKATYQIGVIKAVVNVLPIGCFMLVGLLRYKNPLRNWYIGCTSIIIWYIYAVRNRP